MKTHKVIDTFYSDEESNDVFVGTFKECNDFIDNQQDSHGHYMILPMSKEEKELENS